MKRYFVLIAALLVLTGALGKMAAAEEQAAADQTAPAQVAAPAEAATPAEVVAVQPAQEEAAVGEKEYAYGTVNTVSADQIVVQEYNYETGEETAVTYALDPAVKVTNVAAVKDIVAGDSVEVEFLTKDGKKVAVGLDVERLPEEEVNAAAAEPVQEASSAPVQEAAKAPVQ